MKTNLLSLWIFVVFSNIYCLENVDGSGQVTFNANFFHGGDLSEHKQNTHYTNPKTTGQGSANTDVIANSNLPGHSRRWSFPRRALIKKILLDVFHRRTVSILQIINRVILFITQSYQTRIVSTDLDIQITLAVNKIFIKYTLVDVLVHVRKIALQLKIVTENLLANVKADGSLSKQTGPPGLFEILARRILAEKANKEKIPQLKKIILSTILKKEGTVSIDVKNDIIIVIENAFKEYSAHSWKKRVILTANYIYFNVKLILSAQRRDVTNHRVKYYRLWVFLKKNLEKRKHKLVNLQIIKEHFIKNVINFKLQRNSQISTVAQNKISVAVENVINQYNIDQIWWNLQKLTIKIQKIVENIPVNDRQVQVSCDIGTSEFYELLLSEIDCDKDKLNSVHDLQKYVFSNILRVKGSVSPRIMRKIMILLHNILEDCRDTYKTDLPRIVEKINIALSNVFLNDDIQKNLQLFLQNHLNLGVSPFYLTRQIANIILAKRPHIPKLPLLIWQHYILHLLFENNFGVKGSHACNDLLLIQIFNYVELNLASSLAWGKDESSSAIDNVLLIFPTIEKQLLITLNQNINAQGLLRIKKRHLAEKLADTLLDSNDVLCTLIHKRDLVAQIKHHIFSARSKYEQVNIYDLENNIANCFLEMLANEETDRLGESILESLYKNHHLGIRSSNRITSISSTQQSSGNKEREISSEKELPSKEKLSKKKKKQYTVSEIRSSTEQSGGKKGSGVSKGKTETKSVSTSSHHSKKLVGTPSKKKLPSKEKSSKKTTEQSTDSEIRSSTKSSKETTEQSTDSEVRLSTKSSKETAEHSTDSEIRSLTKQSGVKKGSEVSKDAKTIKADKKLKASGINSEKLKSKIFDSIDAAAESQDSSQDQGEMSKALTSALTKEIPLILKHLSFPVVESKVSQIIEYLKAQGKDFTSKKVKGYIYQQVSEVVMSFIRTLYYKISVTFNEELPTGKQQECLKNVGNSAVENIFLMDAKHIDSTKLGKKILPVLVKCQAEAQAEVIDLTVKGKPKLVTRIQTDGFNVEDDQSDDTSSPPKAQKISGVTSKLALHNKAGSARRRRSVNSGHSANN